MWLLNLGWAGLALLTCIVSLFPPDTDSIAAILGAAASIAVMAYYAHGLGLFLWVVAIGIFASGQFYGLGNPEMAWTPLFLGALISAYNLGGARSFTLTIALSQLAIILIPVPTLATHFSLEAIPAGLAGIALAAFSAFSISVNLGDHQGSLPDPQIFRSVNYKSHYKKAHGKNGTGSSPRQKCRRDLNGISPTGLSRRQAVEIQPATGPPWPTGAHPRLASLTWARRPILRPGLRE